MSELSPPGETPPRPDPWATIAPREALRDNSQARIVSLAPSINQTPRGNAMIPLPYNLVDFAGHDESFTPTVRFTSQKAMVLRSITQHVHGDEQGTGGGFKSGTCGGICEPIGHAPLVRAEGSPVIRHLDRFWMNNRNTVGEALFVRDTASYPAPADRDPIPGSARSASGGGSPEIMSDAAPDPSLFRPGAQLAYTDPHGTFTRAPPTTSAPPRPAPTSTPAQPQGFGPWRRLMIYLGLAEAGHELGDMAGRAYAGPDGVRGKQLSDALTDSAPSGFSPQGHEIGSALSEGGMGPIDGTNTMLSLKAGRPIDFRTAPAGEIDELLHQPWPSAEQLARNRQALREQRERQRSPAPVSGAPGNVRVSDPERERRCKVGPYSEMKNYCAASGGQAHHIVPDYTLRYGNRADGEAGRDRIPNMPTFGNGPSICLQGQAGMADTEHYEAHLADARIADEGAGGRPPDTARIADVRNYAESAVIALRLECAVKIRLATDTAFSGVDPNQLARTKKSPLPSGATLSALRTGMKAQ